MTLKLLTTDKYSDEVIKNLLNSNENPVVISFIAPVDKNLVTIPVWTIFFDQKFYIFTGAKSLKIKAIKNGLTNFSLAIVDKKSFPDVYSSKMPYLSVSGKAKIVSNSENDNIAQTHIKLLEKYNFKGAPKWIEDLIAKIKKDPESTWLIEITPQKFFIFDE